MVKKRFGEFLVGKGVISRQELVEALKFKRESSGKLGEALVSRGLLDEGQLTNLLGEFFGLPVFTLGQVESNPEVATAVPQAVAFKYRLVPVALKEGNLYLAAADRLPQVVLENLRRVSGRRIIPVLMSPPELADAWLQAYPDSAGFSVPLSEELAVAAAAAAAGETVDIIKLLDDILLKAHAQRASDVHLEPEGEQMRVRFRVDGVLNTVEQLPTTVAPLVVSRLKVLSRMNIAERRSPQDGGFLFQHLGEGGGVTVSIRASVLPCVKGEKMVLRLQSTEDTFLKLENIGMEQDTLTNLRQLLALPHGILFVTGPTGSGKTRTLYSALKYLRSDRVNITTVEDPVEVELPGVTQTRVRTGDKVAFSNVLGAILRQDPNIIMIGEVRDGETAGLTLQAALTGHLVLSTLHTNDAAGSFARLVDMGCEPFLIGAAIRGVLAQRLVRVICQQCSEPYSPTPAELQALGLSAGSRETFHLGRGCATCQGTGYRGRTGIFELLVVDAEMQKLVSESRNAATLEEYAARQGMRVLRQDGILKVRAGVTTAVEVIKTAARLQTPQAASPATPQLQISNIKY